MNTQTSEHHQILHALAKIDFKKAFYGGAATPRSMLALLMLEAPGQFWDVVFNLNLAVYYGHNDARRGQFVEVARYNSGEPIYLSLDQIDEIPVDQLRSLVEPVLGWQVGQANGS